MRQSREPPFCLCKHWLISCLPVRMARRPVELSLPRSEKMDWLGGLLAGPMIA